jgi:hypothetical protein
MGVKLHGTGFIIDSATAGEKSSFGLAFEEGAIKDYLSGSDMTRTPRHKKIIDFYGLDYKCVLSQFPDYLQIVADQVRPDRDAKAANSKDAAQYAREWWLFGKPRPEMRKALAGTDRYIATVQTSKHSIFQFVPTTTLPDATLVVLCLENAENLSVCSSKFHVTWSLASGGWLGIGNDPRYNHSKCFNPFPFPTLTDTQKTTLRTLGEDLDAHRKRRQAEHPKLTLTQMYNVLEKLRVGEKIEGKDKDIYDQGLIGILRDLHDRIDAAVADAYGWPVDLRDEEILLRLVALNKERAEEEARGLIRWLRPDYQNPTGQQAAKGKTADMDLGVVAKIEKAPWPKTLPEQIAAVREALGEMGEATPEQIARRFVRGQARTVEPLMESLAALGQAELGENGRYAA